MPRNRVQSEAEQPTLDAPCPTTRRGETESLGTESWEKKHGAKSREQRAGQERMTDDEGPREGEKGETGD